MSTDPAVADQRDVLTRTHIPEDLLAKGRDSGVPAAYYVYQRPNH